MSKEHELGVMSEVISIKEGREIGTKLNKVEKHEDGSERSKEGGTICECILLILYKECQKQFTGVWSGLNRNCDWWFEFLFMVSNRIFGLFACLEIISEKYFDLSILTHF